MSWFEIQFAGQLAQQVQGGSGSPVQVEDLEQTGVQGGDEGASSGGLAGSHFTGQQADGVMLHEELQSGVDLIPTLGSKQLLVIGVITERRFLKAEEIFPHTSSSAL